MTVPPDASGESCRNCGAAVAGVYCANCGQETRIELPTFRAFMREAAGRYVALDGRLWRTLYALIARPGFLTLEYFAGRRRRYIRPARLFLVTSILLFAVIGLVQSPTFVADEVPSVDTPKTDPAEKGTTANPKVSTPAEKAPASTPSLTGHPIGVFSARSDGKAPGEDTLVGLDDDLNVTFRINGNDVLPEELKNRYAHFRKLPKEEKAERIYAGMLRFGPYAMVALLPAFALLLQLAYIGRGNRYPGRPRRYAEHLVYSAHLHAFAALVLILMVVVPLTWFRVLLGLWIVIYVLRARQRVYRGRWWAGMLRALLVAMIYTVLISFAMLGLVIAAVLLR